MVFDHNTNPAYIHTPEMTGNWLRFHQSQGHPFRGYQVRLWLGGSMRFVSVAEYLSNNYDKREKQ